MPGPAATGCVVRVTGVGRSAGFTSVDRWMRATTDFSNVIHMTAADPGATPTAARSLAPDLARGAMLLLIALANVHLYVYGHPLGPRGYPRDVAGVDSYVAVVQMALVDGRAIPMFGLLFGYGVVQLASRRSVDADVPRLVRRRGLWMVAIGLVHGLLLWSGDIVGAYGIVALLFAGLLVRGSERGLLITFWIGAVLVTLLYSPTGFNLPGTAFLRSMEVTGYPAAVAGHASEWLTATILQGVTVVPLVALGAWAARRRILDEPQRHRRLLVRAAAVGIPVAVLGGLPLALAAGQFWPGTELLPLLGIGTLHAASGIVGGIGFAALFGLLAIRLRERGPGPFTGALQAAGQRSLSCYLAQSVAFAALLPAWSLGLGGRATLWQAALVGIGAWLVITAIAAASARSGYRGPAEILLRRLTYGPAYAVGHDGRRSA